MGSSTRAALLDEVDKASAVTRSDLEAGNSTEYEESTEAGESSEYTSEEDEDDSGSEGSGSGSEASGSGSEGTGSGSEGSGSEGTEGSEGSEEEDGKKKGKMKERVKELSKKVVKEMAFCMGEKLITMLCFATVASGVVSGVAVGSYYGGFNNGRNSVVCAGVNKNGTFDYLAEQYCGPNVTLADGSPAPPCDPPRVCVGGQCITPAPFSTRLVWNSFADLDTYVTDPNGCTTYFRERFSICPSFTGYLEYDCIACPLPQQEYTFVKQPVAGVYTVSVSLFDNNLLPYPIPFDLYVAINGVETQYSGQFTAETSNPATNGTRLPGCSVCPAIQYKISFS